MSLTFRKQTLSKYLIVCVKMSQPFFFGAHRFPAVFMETSSNCSFICQMGTHLYQNQILGMMFYAAKLLISNKLITHQDLVSSLSFTPTGDLVTILDFAELTDSWVNVSQTSLFAFILFIQASAYLPSFPFPSVPTLSPPLTLFPHHLPCYNKTN